ncbi:MAG: hypothetical protein F4196_03510, partial [Acidimicrobiia bacterium]|nr:hypothetical protein [Acidimicrobiia bacterium]
MSDGPFRLRAGVIGFVIVMFATACGGEEPATGSLSSQPPPDAPVSSGSLTTATDPVSTEPDSASPQADSAATGPAEPSPTADTTEPAGAVESATPGSSTTV